jgi:hypothetical protein
MFLDMLGYLRFSATVFREPPHQLNELLGGGPRLRLWQRRTQLRHHLITHCDLNPSACVLPHLANQLGQSFARFADREFHRDEVYKGVQSESTNTSRFAGADGISMDERKMFHRPKFVENILTPISHP